VADKIQFLTDLLILFFSGNEAMESFVVNELEITPDELFFLLGPCVIEDEAVMESAAETLAELREKLDVPIVFKSSFDKANRTSLDSYRGPGLDEGLRILDDIRERYDFPIITDIHQPKQAEPASDVADILQIPAFLCRQTDLLVAVAESDTPVNIKKGQFLDPENMIHSVTKVRRSGEDRIMVTERGTVFGYNKWVVDMRNLVTMRNTDAMVVYDATHSVQLPGAQEKSSGGQREHIAPQARAATAVGINGIFMETHPHPEDALCDGPNMIPLDKLEPVLQSLIDLHDVAGQYRHEQIIDE
jgi:2-dehydro-3-deoxyphosphooctonate aldolase (KDO 8-P synthase)